jgi:Na+/melibiose symporter-like transporter
MDKQSQIWEFYQSLRSEMLEADKLCNQLLSIQSAATAAILSAAFSQQNETFRFFILLSVYVVTIPCYRLIHSNRRRTWRISTYLIVFLEPELDQSVSWETNLLPQTNETIRLNKSTKKLPSSLIHRNEWIIVCGMNLIATLLACYSICQINNMESVWRKYHAFLPESFLFRLYHIIFGWQKI